MSENAQPKQPSGALIALILVLAFVLGAGGYMGYAHLLDDSGQQAQASASASAPTTAGQSNRSVSRAENGGSRKPVRNSETQDSGTYRMNVSQVDNSAFPKVTIYAEILDPTTGKRAASLDKQSFKVTEVSPDSKAYEATVEEIVPVGESDSMFVNLVLDHSASMTDADRMSKAQDAANSFIDSMALSSGTQAEITAFNSYVSTPQPFSSDSVLLHSAVNDMYPDGDTALNDALYHALLRTNKKVGSRVVIGFTDGQENNSNHSESDVVGTAKATGIPVYLIGLGDEYDAAYLEDLAGQCNGKYYSASDGSISSALREIYAEVYETQRNMYRVTFTSSYNGEAEQFRTIRVVAGDDDDDLGAEIDYVPVDDVPEYDTTSRSEDYLLPDVAVRDYSREELERFSLWELYLARNEIFARHGRIFTLQQDLDDYFRAKQWYEPRLTGDEFAELDEREKQLNAHEDHNAELMIEIEKQRDSPYLSK